MFNPVELGDFEIGESFSFYFNSRNFANWRLASLSDSPDVGVLKNGNDTRIEDGVTLTADAGGIVGSNRVSVDTSVVVVPAYTQANYTVILTAGQLMANPLDGEIAAHFSLENRHPSVEQIREELDDNSAKLAAVLDDTDIAIPALIDAVQTVINSVKGNTALDIPGRLLSLEAITNAIVNDTGVILPDALDFIEALAMATLEDTSTTIPGLQALAQAKLDIITGSDGAILATVSLAKIVPTRGKALSDLKFVVVNAAGAPVSGALVAAFVSKDNGGFSLAEGVVVEVGDGAYSFSSTDGDMDGNIVTFRFISVGNVASYLTLRTS